MTLKKGLMIVMIILGVLAFDVESKALVDFFIPPIQYASSQFPFGGIIIFEKFLGIDFCLNNAANKGMAWGMLGQFQDLLLISRIGLVIGLVGYLLRSPKAVAYHYPLALVIGGAVGNILDYFIYGHVVDMFHFLFWGYSYPIFNIADASIFCGTVWMLLKSSLLKKKWRSFVES